MAEYSGAYSASSGCQASAEASGSNSGTHAAASSSSGIRPWGTNRSTPHSSAWANSLKIEATGVRRPMICSRTSSGPATVVITKVSPSSLAMAAMP